MVYIVVQHIHFLNWEPDEEGRGERDGDGKERGRERAGDGERRRWGERERATKEEIKKFS